MNTEGEYLTQEKFDQLSNELKLLKTVKRKEIAENLEYAKSLGDLSENQEYQEARDAQGVVEDRISRLETMLKSATIVSHHETNQVVVGAVITVEKESDSSRKIYTMVGSEEADATAGRISVRSPFGQAAMGKKGGEKFSFFTPSGMMSYKIIDIK